MQVILSILAVAVWWFVGFAVVRRLSLKLTFTENLAAGWVAGFFLAMWTTFLFSFVFGYTTGLVLAHGLLVVVGVVLWKKGKMDDMHPEPLPKHQAVRWLYSLFWILLAAAIYSFSEGHFLHVNERGDWLSAGYTWADLALHQTLAAYFAHQPAVELGLPIYSGAQLSYPFLTDFLSGMLYRIGGNWLFAFIAPTFLCLLALSRLIVAVSWRALGSMKSAVVQLWLALTAGSAAAWMLFAEEWSRKGWDGAMKTDWTMIPEQGLAVAAFVTSHLLPQRTYLAGFLVFLVLALVWRRQSHEQSHARMVVLGVLYGGLPFVHVHSFLVVSLLSLLFLLWRVVRKFPTNGLGWSALIGLLLALPQLTWQLSASFGDGFIYRQIGWLTRDSEWALTFWLRNWGAIFLLAPLGYFFMRGKKQGGSWLVPLMVSSIMLFVACNVVSFQPYAWDNMKLLTYAYFFLLFPTSALIGKWLEEKRTWVIAGISLFLLSASGFITLVRETREQYVFLSADERAAGGVMLATIPDGAVVLASDRHNHPVTLVAGRQLLSGYPGWLWSYGIDNAPHAAAARELWRGGGLSSGYIQEFGITHAVLGPGEEREVGFQEISFEKYFEEVSETNGWRVYRVR